MTQKIGSSCAINQLFLKRPKLQDPEALTCITIYSLLFGLFQLMMNSCNPVLLAVI